MQKTEVQMRPRTRSMVRGSVPLLASLAIVYGCSNKLQPSLENPLITPPRLDPDKHKEVFVSVNVNDPRKEILYIELSSPQLPGTTFILNDKGADGDKEAGDDLWSIVIQLPSSEEVPRGTVQVIFRALDKEYAPVMVKGPQGREEPLRIDSSLLIMHLEER